MTIDYNQLAKKHGFSRSAVEVVAAALARGNGTQAQFNHPELGGMGQWQPTMIMIGDAFNHALKARVDALCNDLAGQVRGFSSPLAPMRSMGQWWPDGLGAPTLVGGQNNAHYAYFQQAGRLLIKRDETIIMYDVSQHVITGASQQQDSTIGTLRFQTRNGTITEADLKPIRTDE